MTAALRARRVELPFGTTPALRGADLEVAAGEIVAVMGPSGSGKSTLLHCLAGILVPDAGEVLVGDERIDTLDETRRSALRRDRFGFASTEGEFRSDFNRVLVHPPGPGYYATTLGGLAVSLALILSTTPLLRRLTGPETARND